MADPDSTARQALAREALSHVLWLGGAPCAGKSSIAGILAAAHHLPVYHCHDCRTRSRRG